MLILRLPSHRALPSTFHILPELWAVHRELTVTIRRRLDFVLDRFGTHGITISVKPSESFGHVVVNMTVLLCLLLDLFVVEDSDRRDAAHVERPFVIGKCGHASWYEGE